MWNKFWKWWFGLDKKYFLWGSIALAVISFILGML